MSRASTAEIAIPQTRSAAAFFDGCLRDLRAARAIEDEPALAAWTLHGCPRSAMLDEARRSEALEWLLVERSGVLVAKAPFRRHVFGDKRGAAIARRREAMFAELEADAAFAAALGAARDRFLAYRAALGAARSGALDAIVKRSKARARAAGEARE